MKTTIDVPDDLYRRVKARAALLGLPVREVTIDLYKRWLGDERASPDPAASERWVDAWREAGLAALGDDATHGDRSTMADIVKGDRARLDRS